MTVLTVVNDVCDRLALPRVTGLVGKTGSRERQLLAFANERGRALARDWAWSGIKKERTFTAVAAQIQVEPPADFDRFAEDSALYDTGLREALIGPLQASEWAEMRTWAVSPPPGYWMMVAGKINIWPVPAATDTFRFAYVSNAWVRPATGSDKSAFTIDSDTMLFPEEAMTLHLIWRFKQAKGLDYAEDMATAERETERMMARDRGPVTAAMSRTMAGPHSATWPGTVTVA